MNTKSSNFKKWFTFIVLVLGGGTIYKLSSLKDAFYVPMQEQFHLTHTQIGNAMSVYSTIATFAYLGTLFIADRFSKKILLPFSLIATGCLGLYLATFPGYHGILFVWAMFGITCELTYWPILLKSIRSLGNKEEQGRMFGFLEAGRGVVDTIVAFTALAIFACIGKGAAGLRGAILFFSITVIGVGVITFFCLEHDEIAKSKDPNKNKIAFQGIVKALKMKEIWVVAFTVFSVYAVYCGLTYFIPFLKDIYGLPVTLVGAYGIINQYGLKMVGGPVGGFLADKKFKSSAKYLRVAFLATIIGMVIFMLLPHESMNVYIGMAATLGFGAIVFTMRAVFFAPMEEINVPREISGSAMSIGSFVGYAPAIFCYSLYGNMLDRFPGMAGYRIVFMLMAGFAVVGFLISSYLVRIINKRKEASAT
ncbi:MFS transporter [Crassaminicella thermophila]|uniref:MFS transporter n=1 Tax=Crassaminicella thermophila TaxID=2599308 RepID=A0A5C0SFY6_CRATE|nr:MFS transporter [Crassaminicella thermophila]QEK13070.1 MFS transporter [Crassaminicella thermophila]